MLESVKIARRQSEIRQALAGLVGKADLTEDETRSIETLDAEYRSNETKYRGALIVEDTERREAGKELETRDGKEYADLVSKFEVRQVADFYSSDEGVKLTGETAEVVTEMRSKGAYRGIPVPFAALELRAGETIASGTPDPMVTKPIIDRLFPGSVAGQMGCQMINIDTGAIEYPVVTSSVSAGWADGELANVGDPTAFATTDKPLKPEQNFGVQMVVSRKTLKQSSGIEQAIRRDMNSAIAAGLDKAIFLGTGANGQPLGVITGQSTYGFATTAVSAAASWAAFRSAVVRFMAANAATGPGSVSLLLRPEVYDFMDGTLISGTAVSEWDRLLKNIASPVMSSNALAAPAGTPKASTALLTTRAGGVSPIFCATWGGIDLVRDVYSGAAAGSLKLVALLTADVTVARPAQLQMLTGVQSEASGG